MTYLECKEPGENEWRCLGDFTETSAAIEHYKYCIEFDSKLDIQCRYRIREELIIELA